MASSGIGTAGGGPTVWATSDRGDGGVSVPATDHQPRRSGTGGVDTAALVAAAVAGDHDAFSTLVQRHRRELHVHCYRMLGSYDEAEDAVQEVMLRAWRRRDSFQGGELFRAWLYRIATNACLDNLRRTSRRARAGGTFAEVPWLQPYPDVELDEVAAHDDERGGSGPRCWPATCSGGRPPRPPPCST